MEQSSQFRIRQWFLSCFLKFLHYDFFSSIIHFKFDKKKQLSKSVFARNFVSLVLQVDLRLIIVDHPFIYKISSN